MASREKGTFQPVTDIVLFSIFIFIELHISLQDSDVHITFEDQQKINRFARLNAKFEDLKDEIKLKEVLIFNYD